jgi:hypothetical protein
MRRSGAGEELLDVGATPTESANFARCVVVWVVASPGFCVSVEKFLLIDAHFSSLNV